MNPQMKRERNKLEHGNNALVLAPSCRWVDISTWTPTPQGCLYLKARHLSLNLHNLDIFGCESSPISRNVRSSVR